MNGYITTKKEFSKLTTEKIIKNAERAFGQDNPPINAWTHLIDDIKKSSTFKQLPDHIVIGMEYACVTNGMMIDLLLAFADKNNQKRAFIVESKDWSDDYIDTLTFSDNRRRGSNLHPQIQVSNHALSFSGYTNIGDQYQVTPFVYVKCSKSGIEKLIDKNPDKEVASRIKVTNKLDVIFDEIKRSTLPHGNPFVHAEIVSELQNAYFKPSKSIIDAMGNVVDKEPAFILTDKQQQVLENVLDSIRRKKKIIKISGPAGSGKTAILTHLYGELLTIDKTRPILVTGAYNTDYYRSAFPNSDGIFEFSRALNKIIKKDGHHYVVLMDEAQHNTEGEATKVLRMGATLVVCYDEMQTIRAVNCVDELRALEASQDFVDIKLTDSMRYNGSTVAEQNVKNYLENKPLVKDDAYDFQICNSLQDFQTKLTQLIEDNPKSTVATIGLLCNDEDNYTVKKNKKSKLFTRWREKGECEWMKYVEEKNYLSKNNGKIWVGTWWMQGLDVDYVAVIVGGDASLTTDKEGGVKVDLNRSKLYQTIISVAQKMGLPYYPKDKAIDSAKKIVDYVNKMKDGQTKLEFEVMTSRYVKNYYYIMMTRGRKGCIVYFANNKRA